MQAATQQNESTQSKVRLRGFIKDANVTRGFGFIRGDDGNEYFLHVNELDGGVKGLVKRTLVEFTPISVGIAGKCDRAVNAVVVLEAKPRRIPNQ